LAIKPLDFFLRCQINTYTLSVKIKLFAPTAKRTRKVFQRFVFLPVSKPQTNIFHLLDNVLYLFLTWSDHIYYRNRYANFTRHKIQCSKIKSLILTNPNDNICWMTPFHNCFSCILKSRHILATNKAACNTNIPWKTLIKD
jgi:hypothetical protein